MNRIMALLLASLMMVFTTAFAQESAQDSAQKNSDSNSAATVVFYRAADDGGKAYALTSQNKELAKLKKGDRFEQKLPPGTYYYMADPSSQQVFQLDINAGETYYVLASKDGSFFTGQPNLKLANAKDYQLAIANN
jgi:hypothetical protein